MERMISQLKQEVPDKDVHSVKSAMHSYVQQLDKDAIPQFLSRLSELRDGQASGQHSISWYEVMALEHGKLIIPYISEMMRNVLKALSSDAPSLELQQACSKVVSALARYTIEPSSFERQREGVIRDLANPLLEVLLGNTQSLSEGAAMCLQTLVSTEVWKFAPEDIVNEVCLRVTGALEEKGTQTTDHMKLVCSLAKHNGLILEPYGRSLLKAAADILETGNWQLRLHAVQMINTLLKSVESDILASEILITITNMERCRSDRMPSIRNAASETLQIAMAIASERGINVSCESFSSEVGVSNEDIASQKSIYYGISQFLQDTQMDSYSDSPVSSWHSFNTKYQTPSVSGSATGARRSHSLHGSKGHYSDSIDEGSFSGKIRDSSFSMSPEMSHSKRPISGTDMTIEQTPCSFLNHRGKDVESRGNFFGKSQLENGIVSEGDAEIVECEGDGGTPGRIYYYEDRRSGLHMLRQRESRDTSTCDNDCIEKKHSFWINYTQSPLPSDVDEEEDTERPKNAVCMTRAADMHVFSTPRAFVRPLQLHSSPTGKNRKTQYKNEFTDSTDGNYDKYDALSGENNAQMTAVLKRRLLLDNLESVADGFSDRRDSQEGSAQNSSVWSESMQRSNSLSPTSSTVFQDVSDNEEDYLNTLLSEPNDRNTRMDDGKENCHTAEVDSVAAFVDSSEFEETSAFFRGWKKVMYFMESILGGSLCAVLAVPVTMVAVKLFSMQEEYHVMVPT